MEMANAILELLQRYNRISVILISILASLFLIYLSLYIYYAIYFVPVAAFFVMHYLKFYRFLPRLVASMLISFVAVLLMSGIYASIIQSSSGVSTAELTNGTIVTASVTPFNHEASDYNFSFVLSGNTSLDGYYVLVQGIGNTYSANYSSQISSINDSNGNVTLYVHDSNLPATGAYEYSLFLSNGTRLASNTGPVFSAYALFPPLLASLGPSFWILFELIFVIGVFVARSFSHSMSYRNPPQVPPGEEFSEEPMEPKEK